MNKKGFTLVELITTFALTSVLVILLINVVLLIKNVYTQNKLKTNLIIEQSNLSHIMNKKFTVDNLESYTPCLEGNFCYEFSFIDGTSSKLIIDNIGIKFDNYTYDLIQGSKIEIPVPQIINIESSDTQIYNSILVIKIPIKHKFFPNEDFGVNVIYQFNSTKNEL